jgi:diadenosine tetraphosphate (Ap4A) HIT family hydrolase
MYKFKSSIFFIVLILLAGFNTYAETTWVINPTLVPTLDASKPQEFVEALSHANIKVIYDNTLKVEASNLLPEQTQSLTPLLKGTYVEVCLVSPSLEELHVGLVVKDFLTLKGEALQEFIHFTKYVVAAFQELGYGDYLAFCNFGKTYDSPSGKKLKDQCWEMIPLGKGHVASKDGDYALTPKVWRNNYVLSNQIVTTQQANQEIIKKFTAVLKSYLSGKRNYPPFFCQETLPWKIRITDLQESKKAICQRLLSSLQTLGAVKVIDSGSREENVFSTLAGIVEGEFTSYYEKKREDCAFCKQSVLKKQEMVSSRDVTVLYNYLPYTKDAHFLVIPFHHVESLQCLKDSIFAEVIEWAQKISLIMNDQKNLVWFCQNGPRAGQTTPHFHLHVLQRPDPVLFPMQILNEISGNPSKRVEEKEYQINRERIIKGLQNLL